MVKRNGKCSKAIIKNLKLLIHMIFIFCLSCALIGCGSQPRNDQQVEMGLKEIFPFASRVSVESRQTEEEDEARIYSIDIDGVQFVYGEIPSSDPLFGSVVSYHSVNDYCERLFDIHFYEITNIARKFGVEIKASGSEMTITNHLKNMDEIKNGLSALEEIYNLLNEYIPGHNLGWFRFSIKLYTVYAPGKQLKTEIKSRAEWNFEYEKKLLYLEFKDCVIQDRVQNIGLSSDLLQSIPTKTLNSLYIDGERYSSDRYKTEFVYNLADEKYYTIVCFGIDIVFNGGVKDYLQREIIENYYPEADYRINDARETSSYRIGGNKYSIRRNEDGLIFKKNGKKLDIESYDIISDTNTGASYYYWIDVYDFADIMGMTVEKIDDTGVYLSL